MNAKINLPQYLIFIKPRKLDAADIMCYTESRVHTRGINNKINATDVHFFLNCFRFAPPLIFLQKQMR